VPAEQLELASFATVLQGQQ